MKPDKRLRKPFPVPPVWNPPRFIPAEDMLKFAKARDAEEIAKVKDKTFLRKIFREHGTPIKAK